MRRQIFLFMTLTAIAGVIYYFEAQKPERASPSAETEVATSVSKNYPRARELVSPEGFINVDKISISELVGKKVILVDFWTYSCINCQRTQPYLNAWYEKYGDQGLEIIGVHTPEFEFEKNLDNVRAAVAKADIKYPVVQDNDRGTWQAYGNRYWPRKYLIDIDGYIVYDHIGEGGYEETEKKIQELLKVAGDLSGPLVESIDRNMLLTPEIYFGAERNRAYLGNGKSGAEGLQSFILPAAIKSNVLYLSGDWQVNTEYAESAGPGGKIVIRYQGNKVYMVASSERPVAVRILRDGQLYKTIIVSSSDLYPVIDEAEYGEYTLEIAPGSAGFKIFTFTFG